MAPRALLSPFIKLPSSVTRLLKRSTHPSSSLIHANAHGRNFETISRCSQRTLPTYLTPKVSLPSASPPFGKTNAPPSPAETPCRTLESVPASIVRPPYVLAPNGSPGPLDPEFYAERKGPEAIEKMRRAGALAAQALQVAIDLTQPGVTGLEVEEQVHHFIVSQGAYPSPLRFHGYPRSLVVSVNEVCCHGIPNKVLFKSGDVVKYDCIVYCDGYHGDCAATTLVDGSAASLDSQRLINSCRRARDVAVARCRPGTTLRDIARAIDNVAKEDGFHVLDIFSGHFIGKDMHMAPLIPHTENSVSDSGDFVLQSGHTFTIEPIFVERSPNVVGWGDGWSVATEDRGLSSQWEHTLLITDTGVEILTPLRGESAIPTTPLPSQL